MDLTAGNLDSFEGKNIGVFKDNITEDVLNEWELKYGLHTQHVNVSNTAEVMDKLSKHEIDCFVSVEEPRWEESEISPITSIGETEIYFAINPKRPDIKEALDSAICLLYTSSHILLLLFPLLPVSPASLRFYLSKVLSTHY